MNTEHARNSHNQYDTIRSLHNNFLHSTFFVRAYDYHYKENLLVSNQRKFSFGLLAIAS